MERLDAVGTIPADRQTGERQTSRIRAGISRRAVMASVLAGTVTLLIAGRGRAATPTRIVCAGSDVTETVAAIAGLDVIKGVDTTSMTPPEVKALPSIGYLRLISVEGILSLQPDVLIANKDLGPPTAVEQLRGTGLRIETIDFPLTGEGIAAKIRHIGDIIDRKAEADKLAATVLDKMTALARRIDGVTTHPRLALIRSSDGGAMIGAGRLTLIDGAYALAGGVNAFDFKSFKPVSKEALAASPPDFVLATPDAVTGAGGAEAFLAAGGLADAYRGHPERLVEVDMTTLFGFGPSAPDALTALARRLHPDRFALATP